MDAHGEQRLGNRYPGAVYPPDREYRVHTGVINTARRDGSNWGGIVAVIPNKIQPPRYSVRCSAADWNDDHKYNRGSSFTIYGGSRRIQLYERGMYNVNVELNFTYFV